MSSLKEETKTTLYLLRCYLYYSLGWGIVFGLILGILYGYILILEDFVITIIIGILTGFLITGPIMTFFSLPKIKTYDYQTLTKKDVINQILSKNFTILTSRQDHFLLTYQGHAYFKPKIVLEYSDNYFMLYAPGGLFSSFEKAFHWKKSKIGYIKKLKI